MATARCRFALAAALLLAPTPLLAANADNPQGNVNRANDAGGDTGNSKVDELNKGQLDENCKGATPAGRGDAAPK